MPQKTAIEIEIESALFFRGGAITVKELAVQMGLSKEELENGITSLTMSLEGRGIRVVREGETVALATAPETHELIEKMRREELEGPLGKAGLETISIIIFRGPVSRSDVEYIRGVNCSSILRSLLIRGLIERVENPNDKRSFLYRATPELPAYLGVGSLAEIPGYTETRANIDTVFSARDAVTSLEEETPTENS
ncbi:MAG: SMC-Scp complex subunit ScpB [Patescibacteria group bacterium]